MNLYLIRNIEALCLIGLTYWALGEVINYILIITSLCFIFIANFSSFIQNKIKNKAVDRERK